VTGLWLWLGIGLVRVMVRVMVRVRVSSTTTLLHHISLTCPFVWLLRKNEYVSWLVGLIWLNIRQGDIMFYRMPA